MFQNISGQAVENNNYEDVEFNKKENKLKNFIKTNCTKQKLIVYLITFMLSTIQGSNIIAPFAIAIFAACCSNKVPLVLVYACTILGTAIGVGGQATLTYLLTSLLFITMVMFARPKVQKAEYENEKMRLGKFVFLSVVLVQIGSLFFESFTIYEMLTSIMSGISAYIFYKIFANSLIVINEFGIKKAFAIEEVIGASILLSICAMAFREISIFGFEIKTILSILIVLVLGWKNGVLVGATTGITIGTIVGIVGLSEPILIASYALSGMLAGIFSRFGRIGVIVGFILGNAILTYVANGNTQTIIYLKEILIASLGLLLVPKDIEINIEELFGKTKFLPTGPVNQLEEKKETIYKLNNVSETISEMAATYKEVAATVVEDDEQIEEKNEKIFMDELDNNLETIQENMLYEDLVNDREIRQGIFRNLLANQTITRQDLLDIFASNNNYIIGFDDAVVSLSIEEQIKEVVEIINDAYRISKLNFVWQQRIDENKRTMSSQLEGVSKVINSLAHEMEQDKDDKFVAEQMQIMMIAKEKKISLQSVKIKQEETGRYIVTTYTEKCSKENTKECYIDELEKIITKVLKEKITVQNLKCAIQQESNLCVNTFASEDKYYIQLGIAKATKSGSSVSGDSYITTKLKDGKYLIAISDGMGSGPEARKSSQIAIKMLDRLLTNGFDRDTSVELINSTLSVNSEEDSYATIDIGILDLYKGNIELIKNGACPTYVKHNKTVQIIKALSLPAGILENINLVVYDKDIEDNDILVMCTDGIMESNIEYQNKEVWIKNILEEIYTDNVQKIADILLKESIDNGFGNAKDDMTVIVAKLTKK